MFLILCVSFCCCQWKLGWKISWQRPVPPHHLLPLADSGISRSILNTGMFLSLNSQPFMPLFSVSLLFFHNVCLLCISLKPTFAGTSFEISLPNHSNAPISLSFLSLSSSVNTQSCCWGSDLYQGKLHLIQVTPYTYRAAFLLFSICYASPLRAWSVRLGNLIQVAQHHA